MTYTPSSKEEKDFLDAYDASAYPSISLTVDIVLLTIRQGELCALLVKRGGYPYKDMWALPGGFVQPDENADTAVQRELEEETSIPVGLSHLEQLKTYTDPDRDPRTRVVSTAYLALLPDLPDPVAGDDASQAHFFPVKDILSDGEDSIPLAFDHLTILRDGLQRASNKIEYTSLAMTFLPQKFTIADLRRVYETIWGLPLHPANFRRKILLTPNFVQSCDEKGKSAFAEGKTASLYTRGTADALQPAMLKSSFSEE